MIIKQVRTQIFCKPHQIFCEHKYRIDNCTQYFSAEGAQCQPAGEDKPKHRVQRADVHHQRRQQREPQVRAHRPRVRSNYDIDVHNFPRWHRKLSSIFYSIFIAPDNLLSHCYSYSRQVFINLAQYVQQEEATFSEYCENCVHQHRC